MTEIQEIENVNQEIQEVYQQFIDEPRAKRRYVKKIQKYFLYMFENGEWTNKGIYSCIPEMKKADSLIDDDHISVQVLKNIFHKRTRRYNNYIRIELIPKPIQEQVQEEIINPVEEEIIII